MPLPRLQQEWNTAARAAREFWSTGEADAGISAGLRRLAAANGQSVQGLLERFG